MNYFKHVLIFLCIILGSYVLSHVVTTYNNGDNSIGFAFILLIVSFFVFNILVRKIAWFKPYFTSKYNFLSTKFRTKIEFDISEELMFEKVIEVMESSRFTLKQINKDTFEIFAISPMSFRSWGENIYIDFKEEEGKTVLNFCSATIFQLYSWGKNKENYNKLIQHIEESLTI